MGHGHEVVAGTLRPPESLTVEGEKGPGRGATLANCRHEKKAVYCTQIFRYY